MERFFAVAKGFEDKGINLPERSTAYSAGYDFEAAEDVVVPSMWDVHENKENLKPTMVKTGVKAKMMEDEVLYVYNRSSNPKRGLYLANGTGVIDADYYGNESNDGQIFVPFINLGDKDVHIKKGDRVAQGIFSKYLVVSEDNAIGVREGGIGSTGV